MKQLRLIWALPTLAAALALASCGGSDTSTPDGAAQGGPPPMPQPLTMVLRPDAAGGEKLYIENCAMCHGPNGMGLGLLARRMDQPDLEMRDDLAADYVVQAARMGIGNMPSIPRGEVSDADLAEVAAYLAAGPHGGDGS